MDPREKIFHFPLSLPLTQDDNPENPIVIRYPNETSYTCILARYMSTNFDDSNLFCYAILLNSMIATSYIM